MFLKDFIVGLYGETTYSVLATVFKLYPIWLPLILAILFWELWVRYVRYVAFSTVEMNLLEIRLPRDVYKSPLAMELALNAMFQVGGESTFLARYWNGFVRAWFSLEIVVINGEIHFYVWTRAFLRNAVESHIYSQYPEVEIREVEDYAKAFEYNPDNNKMWACHFDLTQPDPFPIKTYVDYGLNKDPKEEFKNDPLSTMLEFLGSLKPTESVWVQFVIRAHKKEKKNFFSKAKDWRQDVADAREKIIKKMREDGRNTPTAGESQLIEALERNFQKHAFDVGIRLIYSATKESYQFGNVIAIRSLLRPFSAAPWSDSKYSFGGFNSFKASKGTDWDYPWQDFMDIRVNYRKRKLLDAYKRRMFFYAPYKDKTMILTSEELATLFHFPGATASTPGLPRIPSKRAQAPSNLPV